MGISIDFMSVISGDDFQVEEIALNDVYLNLFIIYHRTSTANLIMQAAKWTPAHHAQIQTRPVCVGKPKLTICFAAISPWPCLLS